MLSRKFEVEQSDGVLTAQTVKSGLVGWSVEQWTLLPSLVFSGSIILRHLTHPSDRGQEILFIIEMIGVSAWAILTWYQSYLGMSRIVVDVLKNELRVNGKLPLKLSDVQRIRVVTPFWNLLPGNWRFRWVVLDLAPSCQQVILRCAFGGAEGAAQLEDLVSRLNAFLTERVTAERRTRNTIWSWELGQNIPAEGFYNGRL